ncbi:MAG: patatin-like phospholipase family protein [Cytophagaceae bacterium]
MKTGLVLSGGGARGIAHLGVLKALDEEGIKPDIISGVSSGAICAVMYSAGLKPDEILNYLLKLRIYKYFRPSWSNIGLLNIERLMPVFNMYLPFKTFEELQIPIIISAADFRSGQTVFFSSGELLKPVLASSCIPILFAPLKYKDRLLVDGGVVNNLPVEPILAKVDYIIGSHCNPNNPDYSIKSMRSVIERTFNLAIASNIKERKDHCHLFIEPEGLRNFRIFDLGKAKDIYNIGYKHAKERLKSLN